MAPAPRLDATFAFADFEFDWRSRELRNAAGEKLRVQHLPLHALSLLVAAGAAVWSVAAEAQPYPARPITIVVPYAAGGVFDTMARIIGARMGELLGQSVIVENVTGAGGIIGVQHVINAKPDGYTVLLGTVGTHAYNQSIYRKRRYDAVSDFTPVTLFSDSQMVLEGRKDLFTGVESNHPE